MALSSWLLQCHRTSHYLLQWGEISVFGGREKSQWKQEVISKGTKASAVYLERRGTNYRLSLQVVLGMVYNTWSGGGNWALPAPWFYAQIAFCTIFLAEPSPGQGRVWAELCRCVSGRAGIRHRSRSLLGSALPRVTPRSQTGASQPGVFICGPIRSCTLQGAVFAAGSPFSRSASSAPLSALSHL